MTGGHDTSVHPVSRGTTLLCSLPNSWGPQRSLRRSAWSAPAYATTEVNARRLCSIACYTSAIGAVLTAVRQSVISAVAALLASYVLTLGWFLEGEPPAKQRYPAFLAATMGYTSFFIGSSMLAVHATVLVRYRRIQEDGRPSTVRYWLSRLVVASAPHYLLSFSAVVALGYTLASTPPWLQPYKLPFYLGGLVTNYYASILDVTARKFFRRETVEGVKKGYTNQSVYWKRVLRRYLVNTSMIGTVFIASAYAYILTRMETGSQSTVLTFILVSVALRSLLMKLLKYTVLNMAQVHIRVMYLLTTVPTVFINTQLRIALLRVHGTATWKSLVILTLVEPVMRITRIWYVRFQVRHLLRGVNRRGARAAIAPSTNRFSKAIMAPAKAITAVAPLSVVPREAPEEDVRVQAVKRLLRFTAAEIHSDMCSEYIAIACSTAIYYNFHLHPKYSWGVSVPLTDGSTSVDNDENMPVNKSGAVAVELLVFQVVVEMLIDFVCTVWELVHGIPLQLTAAMNSYLAALFLACAVANTSVCSLLYVHDN